MNEAQGFRLHSTLTPKEEHAAMEAVYGLGGNSMHPPANEVQLSYEERIKMRRYLDALDQKEAGGMKEFDLGKPPVAPYHYREFPFLMYNHETRTTRAAHNHEEREAMAAQGWSADPFPAEGQDIPLTVAEREEAGRLDRLMKMSKEEFEALTAGAQPQPAGGQPERTKKK